MFRLLSALFLALVIAAPAPAQKWLDDVSDWATGKVVGSLLNRIGAVIDGAVSGGDYLVEKSARRADMVLQNLQFILRFSMRGLKRAGEEWTLVCAALNIRRLATKIRFV